MTPDDRGGQDAEIGEYAVNDQGIGVGGILCWRRHGQGKSGDSCAGKRQKTASRHLRQREGHAVASRRPWGSGAFGERRTTPSSLVRFSSRALTATRAELPDIEIAATSGLIVKG